MRAWLYGNAGLTLGMIAVGGLTRLTESGLSITEWKPITGAIPPLSQADWQSEFDKYKASPEFRKLRDEESFDLKEFRRIYLWEWGHRFLGRVIGLTYGLPWLYFVARGRIRGKLLLQTGALLALGGAQGAVGWWMVKSGLEEDLEHPRVNHVRLATHLGSALVIYSGLFWLGMNATEAARARPVVAVAGALPVLVCLGVAGVAVFATQITGALVAGRDAGLIYNRTVVIDRAERERDQDAALQWNHRLFGIGTATIILGTAFFGRRLSGLSRRSRVLLGGAAAAVALQTSLGVATLWSLVSIPLAAAHQIGSVLTLTAVLHCIHDFRRIVKVKM